MSGFGQTPGNASSTPNGDTARGLGAFGQASAGSFGVPPPAPRSPAVPAAPAGGSFGAPPRSPAAPAGGSFGAPPCSPAAPAGDAFGAAPVVLNAFGSSGASTNSTSTFGTSSSTPAFGTSSSTSTFGTSAKLTPAVGAPTNSTPIFGTSSSTSTFGTSASSKPALGASTNSTPVFGTSSSTPAFWDFGALAGSKPVFGGFGASASSTPAPAGWLGSNPVSSTQSQQGESARARLVESERSLAATEAKLAQFDREFTDTLEREKMISEEISETEARLTKLRSDLTQLRTPAFLNRRLEHTSLVNRRSSLQADIYTCTQTLDSLADCLAVSGLSDLRASTFSEWLNDVGLSSLPATVHALDGGVLLHYDLADLIIQCFLTLEQASALLLRGYIAHHGLAGDDLKCAPPAGSVLAWTKEETREWLGTQGDAYKGLADAGWNGAMLCAATPARVVGDSMRKVSPGDAVKLIGKVKEERERVDGEKEKWVRKWGGGSIASQYNPKEE